MLWLPTDAALHEDPQFKAGITAGRPGHVPDSHEILNERKTPSHPTHGFVCASCVLVVVEVLNVTVTPKTAGLLRPLCRFEGCIF